jgi:glycosyltransferase involved in cell wall biosynthesis
MNDDEGMAQAMLFYLNDMKRAKVMGEHETQRLIEMFGIKRMVVETEKVYEEIFPVKKEESIPVSCPRQ